MSKCQVSLGVYSNLITDVCVCLQSKSAIMAQEPSLGSIKSSFFEVFFGQFLEQLLGIFMPLLGNFWAIFGQFLGYFWTIFGEIFDNSYLSWVFEMNEKVA